MTPLISTSTIKLQDESIRKAPPGTLLDALHRRCSRRDFSPQPLEKRHLSQLLWAAYGVNRPDGHRTAPAAMGLYALKLYVFLPEGVFLYRPESDELTCVTENDCRPMAGMQDFVADAPLSIAIFADYEAFHTGDEKVDSVLRGHESEMAALDAGAVAQNIYLYCAYEGINVVERMMMDGEGFARRFGLPPSYHFQVAVTAGYCA